MIPTETSQSTMSVGFAALNATAKFGFFPAGKEFRQFSVVSFQSSVFSRQFSVVSFQSSVFSRQFSVVSFQFSVFSLHRVAVGRMEVQCH